MRCHLALIVQAVSMVASCALLLEMCLWGQTKLRDLDALEAALRRGMRAKRGNNDLPRFTL